MGQPADVGALTTETLNRTSVESNHNDLVQDMQALYQRHGMDGAVGALVQGGRLDLLRALLGFRVELLQEELDELRTATAGHGVKAADDAVDALIDLVVVALGTLHLLQVDTYKAWREVLEKNMAKQAGVNAKRPNPFGLPDLVKPDGWTAPSHADNVGLLGVILQEQA